MEKLPDKKEPTSLEAWKEKHAGEPNYHLVDQMRRKGVPPTSQEQFAWKRRLAEYRKRPDVPKGLSDEQIERRIEMEERAARERGVPLRRQGNHGESRSTPLSPGEEAKIRGYEFD